MTLLAGTRVRADVWPATVGPGEFGATELLPPDTSVEPALAVFGSLVRPTSDVDTAAAGYDDEQRLSLRCRSFPWPARSAVRIQGEIYDVAAPPRTRGYGTATRHVDVPLVARGRGLAAAPDGRARPA